MFGRLAIFCGPFTLETAETVTGAAAGPGRADGARLLVASADRSNGVTYTPHPMAGNGT